jgi:hypothetical protein
MQDETSMDTYRVPQQAVNYENTLKHSTLK